MAVVPQYYGIFPTVLFVCPDDVQSMHFIFSLRNISRSLQETIVELMLHCGAAVSFNVEDATNHSAIIVDHNEVVNVEAPAFKMEYIKDCLQKLKLQNISDYRQDATRHIAKDLQCMDVVYFRTQGWESVLTQAEKLWLKKTANSNGTVDSVESESVCNHFDVFSLINSRLRSLETKEGTSDNLLNEEPPDLQKVGANSTCEKYDNSKNNNFKKQEILDLKNIKDSKNLQNKSATSSNEKFINSLSMHSDKNQNNIREIPSTSKGAPAKKWSFLDEFQSESSDEEDSVTVLVDNTQKSNFFDIEAANDDFCSKPLRDTKHSRMPYSFEEQSNILKYIVEHNEFARLKGRELWVVMERRKVCRHRTWQSMKEHFLKKICLSLEAFDFLTESQKKKIKMITC